MQTAMLFQDGRECGRFWGGGVPSSAFLPLMSSYLAVAAYHNFNVDAAVSIDTMM